MPRNEHLVDDEPAPPPKKKRRFGSDHVERALLIASLILFGMAIKFTLSLGRVQPGKSKGLASMEIVWVELASEVEPQAYDSSVELRIPLAERGLGHPLKPFVVVLRGPWGFGSVEMDKVILALGSPVRRGPGYLVYELGDGKIRLGALFNAGRLDTLYLTPAPAGEKPSAWGLTPRQIQEEALQLEPPAGQKDPCRRQVAPARGLFYVACGEGEPSIPAVYIQRVTPEFRNPPHLRGITGPPPAPAEPWTAAEYDRLLAHYRESARLKQRALSAGHASLHFWKFETARLLVEAGRAKEAAKPMREAIGALSAMLGPDHEDVAAMRLWLPKSR
jgi:hypothetical protein